MGSMYYYVICRVDGRDKDITLGDQWSESAMFHTRAHFIMKDGQISHLYVKNIQPQDEGLYRCRIDYKLSPTSNAKVNLTVIGKLHANCFGSLFSSPGDTKASNSRFCR